MPGSFSGDTKDALTRAIPPSQHCRDGLLAGLALYGGERVFVTQRAAVARLFWTLLRVDEKKRYPLQKKTGTRLYRTPRYEIEIPERLQSIPAKPAHKCDRVMELRAGFLACGSLSTGTQGYHLEFVLADELRAARLGWMLRSTARAPKSIERKHRRVLYFKDFDTITEVLTTIGAFGAVLHLEEIRALKETKNRIHRLVNTEAANLDRATAAAATQCRTIGYLESAYGLHNLSPALREIANLRLEHRDETLAELGARCNPQIGKPTVNSRLVALTQLARRLAGRA